MGSICLILASTTFAQQKNVLFIAVDDLKPMLTAYGYDQIQTPNIDRIAALGTTFLNASCQQALCAPSRASLLTGLYPDQTQVWDLGTLIRDKTPDVVTLPELFKNNGYFVTGAGKTYDPRSVDDNYDTPSWSEAYKHSVSDSYYANSNSGYQGYHDPQVPIDDAAFNQYMAQNPKADENESIKLFPKAKPTTECLDLPDDAYKDGATVNYLIEKLDELANGNKPFFLAAGISKPHLPFVAPKKYWDLYDVNDIAIHPYQQQAADVPSLAWRNNGEMTNSYSDIPWFKDRDLNEAEQKHLIHGYKACVSYADAQIGKLLDKLETLGIADETIIVFWGDHGWHLGDHNLWAKHSNFEQAVMSPLIIYDPETGTGGSTTHSPVELIDIYPTLCQLVGLPAPGVVEGKSLVPVLQDPLISVREAALSQYHRRSGGIDHMGYTLRDKKYRYTKWVKMDYEIGVRFGEAIGFQLYDLVADPYEATNLIGNANYDDVVTAFELEFKRRNIAQSTPSSFLEVNTCASSYSSPDGSVYTTSGIYTNTLTAKNSMDSIITINLNFVNDLQTNVTLTNGVLTASAEGVNYQWKDCQSSENIPDATAKTFMPTATGQYAVEVSLDGCNFVSECMLVEIDEPPLNTRLPRKLSIFPMPVKDGLMHLDLGTTYSQLRIQLVDLAGSILLNQDYFTINQLDLQLNHPSGIYILRMQADNVIVEMKVAVE